MKYDNETKSINEIIGVFQVIREPGFLSEGPYKSFGMGDWNITIIGINNISKFQILLEKLFFLNKEISETWTLKKFEEDFIDLIRKLKYEERVCTVGDLESLYNILLEKDVKESEILYEFYGASLKQESIIFGDFCIYNYDLSINTLIEKYPHLNNTDFYFYHKTSNLLLGIKVKARENNKAIELADKLCETFENVFSYMISDLKHEKTVGVFNFRGWHTTAAVVCNNHSMGWQGRSNISIPVNIEDPFFKDQSQGNDKVWSLITKNNKTEIEKRLLNSIEWIGKAIYDVDMSKSVVQFVFALEGMLQFNDKGFITPSIVSQLSDWLAFIIHDDINKRKDIAKYVKDLYQKRSAIAHGGTKTIDIQDLQMAKQISNHMIISFLTVKPFCEIETMADLYKYMTDLKFK